MTKFDITNEIFTDEDAARAHLEAQRWPNGPVCPHCGETKNVHRLEGESHRKGLIQCNVCLKNFTVTVGSVMERSHVPLRKWVLAFYLMNASKKGMSAHQMHRMLGITYKTAWFMCHRIREAMKDTSTEPMGGAGESVQADETYYGNTSKRAKGYKKGHSHKASVVGLIAPKTGKVRVFHVETANIQTVRDLLVANVHADSELHTDESRLYAQTGKEFASHKTVRHGSNGRGVYVGSEGQTTNNMENFFGVFKKGMVGVYHFCGEQHVHRYLSEFEFRHNNRSGLGVTDMERAAIAMKGAEGKRLTYRQAH
jgi:transposase-like protein